jgi:aspartate aminotransferase-like enzyme
MERELLMIPGPTNVNPSVLEALSAPTKSHVSQNFVELFRETLSDLKKVFMTKGETFVLAGSGTLAMEAATANFVEANDKVLNLVSGVFGQRFAEITKYHGATPSIVEVPWGKAVTPDIVKEALEKDEYKAVTIVHVDTSTGVANPIKDIGEVVRENSEAFYIVDTVCSLGGMEVRVDDWNIDVCIAGSQKCIATPPGLALIAINRRALSFLETRKSQANFYYGDLNNWLPIMRELTRYFATPPVNMIYALYQSLKSILEEGLENRFRRHYVLAEALRTAIDELGLQIVADRGHVADTVTAIYYPKGVKDQAFRRIVAERGVVIAGGLGPLAGKIFRIGHMGNINANDILVTIGAIEASLRELGYRFEYGSGLQAVQEKLLSRTKAK